MHAKVRAMSPPSIIDRRSEYVEGPLVAPSPGELDWGNPYAWAIEYQCVYDGGALDDAIHGRAMGGASLEEALIRLQRLLAGFGVLRIMLWHVRAPMSSEQMAAVAEANRELERHREFWRSQWAEWDRQYHEKPTSKHQQPTAAGQERPRSRYLGRRDTDRPAAVSTAGGPGRVPAGRGPGVPERVPGLSGCRTGV